MPGGATAKLERRTSFDLALLTLVALVSSTPAHSASLAEPGARPGDWTQWRGDGANTAAARLPASPSGQARGWTFRPIGSCAPTGRA